MAKQLAQLDHAFQALSDPTRRAVIQQLTAGDATVSKLAVPFKMALPSFMQHLDVLEKSGLVRSRKVGRVRIYQLVPKQLQLVEDWMAKQRAMWNSRLDRLDDYLIQIHKGENNDE